MAKNQSMEQNQSYLYEGPQDNQSRLRANQSTEATAAPNQSYLTEGPQNKPVEKTVTMAATPEAPITPPDATNDALDQVGVTKAGTTIQDIDPAVQAEMDKFGINEDVAIGNLAMREDKAMITSDAARDEIKKAETDVTKLEEERAVRDEAIATTTKDTTKTSIEPANEYERAMLEADQDAQYVRTELEKARTNLDATGNELIDALKMKMELRREEQKQITANTLKAKEIIGARSGRQRYAPDEHVSVLAAEERAGIQELAKIDALEAETIANIKMGILEADWNMVNQGMSTISGLRQEKMDTLYKLQDTAMKMEKHQAEMERNAKKDILTDVANIASAGMELDDASAGQLDEALGYGKGFTQAYLKTQKEVDTQEKVSAWIETAMKVPLGESIVTPYGTTITGMNRGLAAEGVSSFRETNPTTGDVTEITTRYNPETQRNEILDIVTYPGLSAPSALTAPKVVDINGVDSVWNPTTGAWEKATLGGNQAESVKAAANEAMQAAENIQALIDHNGLDYATGYALGRGQLQPWGYSDRDDFIGKVNLLIDNEALDAMIEAKENGATFGAMSEGEWDILKNSRSTINSWAHKKGKGEDAKVIGYKIGEEKMKEELTRLKELSEKAARDLGWVPNAGGAGVPMPSSFSNPQEFLRATENIDGISPYKPYVDDIIQFFEDNGVKSPSKREFNDKLEQYLQLKGVGFQNDLSRSINYSNLSKLTNGKTDIGSLGSGTVTGIDGSKYWKWGLDFVVDGGKGAQVKAPVTGTVIDVVGGYKNTRNSPLAYEQGKKQNGGFGNQVKIRTADGREVWVSHLDDVSYLRPGQRIASGQVIGKQGNTGTTYGNTGVHLDITMLKPDGSKYTAREVAALLGDRRLT